MSYSRLALCDDDRCPWKHAAPLHDPGAADRAAEQHEKATGHTSTFYPGQEHHPLPRPSTPVEVAHPEGACRRCGGPNVSWSAPSPLWNAVMRGGSIDGPWEFGELICPTCFVVLAEERGIATGWTVDAKAVHVELETVTPSGRTWDPVRRLWVTRDERGPQDAEAVRLDVARVPVLPEVARAVELAQAARAEELAALPPHVRSLVEQADQRVSAAVADVVLNGNAGVRRPLLWEGDQA